ncbi:glycoside hydrolase family 71 protein [Peniophora sp. CONT]|nr:glycoside hydrolase family 71 protein [Peniophora sp. CONT]
MRDWLALALSLLTLASAAPLPSAHQHQSKSRQPVSARQDATSTSNNTTSQQPKLVIAHHMVGNTFPYTKDDWATDIALASSAGIDAFALNVGSDPWQPDRVKDAYDAAAASGTGFKMFMSFDMTVLPCASPDDASTLRNYITTYASHPGQLTYSSRVLATTFAGESCTFGQSSVTEGWKTQFTQHPDLMGDGGQSKVFFMPSFFVDPATFGTYDGVMDGALNWNSAWPLTITSTDSNAPNVVSQVLSTTSNTNTTSNNTLSSLLSSSVTTSNSALGAFTGTTTDAQYLSGLKSMNGGDSKMYMATASPWFYTHYGADSFNKNFVYYADAHLYPTRLSTLVSNRDSIDMIQLLTWNDYGESSYLGRISGAQPNSQAWVDGFDHTPWLSLTAYYVEAFKTGSYPTVQNDTVWMWSRPHTKDAEASSDGVGKPDNSELLGDTVWAVSLTSAPSTVTLSTSATNTRTFEVDGGVSMLSIDISAGDTMRATVERDGETTVDLNPDFVFQGATGTYNFNAFVAVSS